MAIVLKPFEDAGPNHPILLSEDVPMPSGAGDRVELADEATVEGLRALFRERHGTAQTCAKD